MKEIRYIYRISFSCFLKVKGRHPSTGSDLYLFLYLPMNCMFETIGTEFSQFQSTRCIVSILLSNISGNTCWFLINIVSNTTSTFQNNPYSSIFTLGHEPPLVFWFTQFFSIFRPGANKKKGKGTKNIEIANNSKSNYEKTGLLQLI